jgi:hypothetical protein
MNKKFFVMFLLLTIFTVSGLQAAAQETPEQVYGKVRKTIQAKDFEGLLKLASKNARAKMLESSTEERNQILSFLADSLPSGLKVTKKNIGDKEALLYVEGMGISVLTGKSEKIYGLVYFLKEEQNWKFDSEVWQYEPF